MTKDNDAAAWLRARPPAVVKRRLVWGRPEFGIPPRVAKFGFFAGLLGAVVLLVVMPLLSGR